MLEPITLTHCIPVKIYPPDIPPPGPPPQNLHIHLTVGGLTGDGIVDVLEGAPDGPTQGSVATGDDDSIPVADANEVWIHYHKFGAGPDTIDVEYEVEAI